MCPFGKSVVYTDTVVKKTYLSWKQNERESERPKKEEKLNKLVAANETKRNQSLYVGMFVFETLQFPIEDNEDWKSNVERFKNNCWLGKSILIQFSRVIDFDRFRCCVFHYSLSKGEQISHKEYLR